jgi:2-methylisocitrate lyase-like PEP mutase family enzyme
MLEEKNIDIFINARTDYFIMGLDNSLEETIKRVKLYEESGADGIFVPCIVDIKDIKEVVKSTTLPVNIMTMPDLLSFDILQQTGIKRISQGPFIYNSLMESFENKLKTINKDNSFKSLF